MNSIQIFENPEFGQVRTMKDENGEPWFVGCDIAKALGYVDASKAIKMHVEDEDKTTQTICPSGSNYKTQAVVINESGLYSLILSSKLESAKRFKHWVTSTVLPQIRKTGGYIPVDKSDDDKSIMAKALNITQLTIEEQKSLIEQQGSMIEEQGSMIEEQKSLIEAQTPYVRFAKAITSADNDILVRDLAKLITENGYPIGQQRLFFWLRQHHYLFQHENRPRQEWVERGLFRLSASLVTTRQGNLEHLTTHVTGKGQQYFIDGFKSGRFAA